MSTSETRLDRLEALAETVLLTLRDLANEQRGLASQQREMANEQRELASQQREMANEQREMANEQRGLASQQREMANEQRGLASQQEQLQATLHEEVSNVVGLVTILAENSERHWQAFQVMQAEIRGLQTENRRILERLEAHMRDGHE
jgi:hypothetical protein